MDSFPKKYFFEEKILPLANLFAPYNTAKLASKHHNQGLVDQFLETGRKLCPRKVASLEREILEGSRPVRREGAAAALPLPVLHALGCPQLQL